MTTQGRPKTSDLTPEEFDARYQAAEEPTGELARKDMKPRVFFTGKYSLRPPPPKRLCECGCGQETGLARGNKRNRFIKDHFARSKSHGWPDVHVRRAVAIVEIDRWVAARFNRPPASERTTNVALFRLGKRLGMTRDELKVLIARAQEKFARNADRYVDAHMQSVTMGTASGTIAGADLARRGAQWALEKISADGTSVIERPRTGPAGKSIQIGISIGGITQPQQAQASEMQAQRVIDVVPENHVLSRSKESKVQQILAQVTKDNAHEMTRAIIDIGLNPRAAWELVKEMIEVDEREEKRGV